MIVDVLVYDDDAVQTAYSYLDPSWDSTTGFTGTHQPVTLPEFLGIPVRLVDDGPYEGSYVTGLWMLEDTDTDYGYASVPAFQEFLGALPQAADFDTEVAWPS